jgi:hypothetical protein
MGLGGFNAPFPPPMPPQNLFGGNMPSPFLSAPNHNRNPTAKKYKQDLDTNIYNIKLGVLKDQGEMATGDPVFC